MEKKSFTKRIAIPTGAVLVSMLVSWLVYNASWKIENDTLQYIIANISAVVLFVSIGFGTLLIYPIAFFRGATLGERVVSCLVTPIVWNIKEMIRVTEFFTLAESLYYGFNQGFLLSVFGAFAEMGLCEMICRWRLNKRGEVRVKVISPGPIVSIAAGLVAFFVLMVWGLGVHYFYIYMEVYKALFH
ncbi:MAG: hypothetical protein Kow0099_17130 [Candidatus Abyssubacteria bacterium]